jgi:Flp pilus assembly protein TadB
MIPSRIAAEQRSTAQHIARTRSDPNHIAKRHRVDDYVRTRMQEAGVDLRWSPSALFLGAAGSVVSLGAHLGGIIGVGMAIACLAIALSVGDRVVRMRTRQRSQAALPELTLRLSRDVRSGLPIDRAIRTVASEMTPLPEGFVVMVNQVERGRPICDALDGWGHTASSSAERLLVAALVIGVKHGGDLARTLDMVGEGVRDDLELAERRRVLLMQTTMSALVLVSLPVGFSAAASLVRGEVIYEGPLGLVLLAAGLTLDAAGLLWMRAAMRRLR